ncbi:TIR domain-containing protein [Pseudomonas sp. YL-218 TE3947]|uniref:TIR domain-containing protein n=1 Tax=Pseudomonas TaxID=286 RepID=UPI003D1BC1ED
MDDHSPLYSLALLGDIPQNLRMALRARIFRCVEDLGLEVGQDVSLIEGSVLDFNPAIERCCAALCFSVASHEEASVERLIQRRVPLIPIAHSKRTFASEFPGALGALNGLDVGDGAEAIATALLESAALIPRQRRVFLSYRRIESTEVALQLYAALAARQYDVFLDTHGIHSGEHFQEVLWQKLCDSDVMVYLDTPGYFDSRWTGAEFARATLRGLSVLRVAWPDVESKTSQLISGEFVISESSFAPAGGANSYVGAIPSTSPDPTKTDAVNSKLNRKISEKDIEEIVHRVELLRTQSVANRYAKVVSKLKSSLAEYGGKIAGHSVSRSLIVSIGGKTIAVYPELGVPTSHGLYEATLDLHEPPVAVVYNQVGIKERKWRAHMEWIGKYVENHVRLVTTDEAAWELSVWHQSRV